MKNTFLNIVCGSLFLFAVTTAKAEMNFGVSLMAGTLDTSGHELENANTSDKNSRSFTEDFVGGSLFIENTFSNGIVVGVDYIPVDIEVGSGSRTDSAVAAASGGAENDTGTRTSSADLTDLVTLYANIPLEDTGFYLLGGVHMLTVSPSATLPNSKYSDEDLYGYQIGFGKKIDNYKVEFFYSDFEDIELSPTGGGNNNKIEADADAFGLKLAYVF